MPDHAESELLTVDVQSTVQDYGNYVRALSIKAFHRTLPMAVLLVVISCVFSASVERILRSLNLISNDRSSSMIVWLSVYLAIVYVGYRTLGHYIYGPRLDKRGQYLAHSKASISPVGINLMSANYCTRVDWRGILAIQETRDLILFFVDKLNAMPIPKHCFRDHEQAQIFLTQAKSYWHAANAIPAAPNG